MSFVSDIEELVAARDKSLTTAVPCRLLPARVPVSSSYGLDIDTFAGRVLRIANAPQCSVLEPDDIPTTITLDDTQLLISQVNFNLVQNKEREPLQRIKPDGQEPGPKVPPEILDAFYLRVLAKTIAADQSKALAKALGPSLIPLVVPGFMNPGVEDVVVGLAELTRATPALDIIAWPWLWAWASRTDAQPRTRIYAMQAIEQLLAEKRVPTTSQTLTLASKLRDSLADWDQNWPTFSDTDKKERALTVAQANSTIGTVASNLAQQGINASALAPIPQPPMPSTFPWTWVLGSGVGAVGLLILALALKKRKQTPSSVQRRRP